ncbi:MAG: hypothetical protein SOX72_05755 [Oscillospiraceae bacterium]|nr:hypothetical protein [Oscillospiraceae bacterium]
MKKIGSIIAIIILLCPCIAGCSDSAITNTIDYSDVIGDSPEAAVSPSESYIIECLNQSEFILEIEAVTESNDPNGKLNTDGGYTACVFFSSTLIDQADFSEKSVVEKGTSCGGCIEVYSNEEDATARNEYLAKFDSGILDSGSHTVVGTIVIRASEKLTKEQQTELTQNLISIITSIEHPIDPNGQGNNETTTSSNDASSESTTPISEPTPEPATEPASEPVTEPATEPATEPVTEPVTEPASEPITESPHIHSFSAATCTEPKTCSCGATEGKANGHNWKNATCSDPKTCVVCGITSGLTTGHNFSNGKCTTCGQADPDYNHETMVWIPTNGGTKYHTHAGCSNMEDPEQVTQSEAESLGFTPCKRCH